MILELSVAKPYDFAQSVCDHGWVQLAPCYWDEERHSLRHVQRLDTGKVALLHISAENTADVVTLRIEVEANTPLTTAEQDDMRQNVHWMLKLDEDFSAFYERIHQHPPLQERMSSGRGRLLRSPTLFEDVVKTITTTNTTWRQTIGMVERIVNTLGEPYPANPELRAFPTPQQVAAADDAVFTGVLKLGYRGPYVQQLAREIVAGERDLEALKHSDLPPKELRKELKQIKGVGDYAANTLLMILGRYGELAVDSEVRSLVSRLYFNGEAVTEAQIQDTYRHWDEWKYLVYWFDA